MAISATLFVTCLTDTVAPRVGIATQDVLRTAGVSVRFPEEQQRRRAARCTSTPGTRAARSR